MTTTLEQRTNDVIYAAAFVFAILPIIAYASDCEDGINDCYECSTLRGEIFCDDPFNASHPDVKISTCDGSCVKWVRIPRKGAVSYVRTCSANIDIRMTIAMVCMTESRPGDGHMCFCNKDLCNASPPSTLHHSSHQLALWTTTTTTMMMIIVVVVVRLSTGCSQEDDDYSVIF